MTLTVSHSVQSLEKMGDCTEFPIRPTQKHWQKLREVTQPELSAFEFIQRWQVSHAAIAEICGCSVNAVDRWFCGLSQISTQHKRRLGFVDAIWRSLQ